jgi:hypothetical protein
MEIQFLHENFTEKDPGLLKDHVQRMASGEAPFFPATLGLVYHRLIENVSPKHTPPGFGSSNVTRGQKLTNPTPTHQRSTSTSNAVSLSTPSVPSAFITSIFTPTFTQPSVTGFASSSNLQAPTPNPRLVPLGTAARLVGLKCVRCGQVTPINNLYDGLHCPHCPRTGQNGRGQIGRPFMRCTKCDRLRSKKVNVCSKSKCGTLFA